MTGGPGSGQGFLAPPSRPRRRNSGGASGSRSRWLVMSCLRGGERQLLFPARLWEAWGTAGASRPGKGSGSQHRSRGRRGGRRRPCSPWSRFSCTPARTGVWGWSVASRCFLQMAVAKSAPSFWCSSLNGGSLMARGSVWLLRFPSQPLQGAPISESEVCISVVLKWETGRRSAGETYSLRDTGLERYLMVPEKDMASKNICLNWSQDLPSWWSFPDKKGQASPTSFHFFCPFLSP